MKLRIFLLSLLYLFCVTSDAFAGDTYYLTQEQLNNLIKQIENLQNNNNDMTILLQKQKNELNLQMNEYEILEKNYQERFLITDRQLQNYQTLLNKSKDRELIYKYCIGIAFGVGLILGVVVAK